MTSFHLLPHLGYFLTGEVGEGTLRGNFEILLEPILIYLDASNSATVVGVAVLPRWVFAASPRVRPYLEAGAGVLAGQVNLSQTNCDVNFILEAGGGAMIFMADHVALTLGARFHQCPTQIAAAKTRESTPSLVSSVSATSFGDPRTTIAGISRLWPSSAGQSCQRRVSHAT